MSVASAKSVESQLPALGVGITYSAALQSFLDRYHELVDVLEVEPQAMWLEIRDSAGSYRVSPDVMNHIAQLPGHKLVHSIGTPVGGTMRPDPAQLLLLRDTVMQLNAPWASDHLSFNATPEFKTGFFLPPRQTRKGMETVVTSIHDLKQALPVPIAVETGVNYLRTRADEMPDGIFIATVVASADCGILLDLHNIFANALNGRQSVEDFLMQIPLDRVWEIHLAGGFEMDGFWLDAHSGAIPDHLFEIGKRVVPFLPNLKAIIYEIFPSFVAVAGLDTIRSQMDRLHELWNLRQQPTVQVQKGTPIHLSSLAENEDSASPAEWELALGRLVLGRPPDNRVAQELATDPGIDLVNRLICEFHASMVVGVLRLTSRLMMLALGQDVFRAILADFWSKNPPQQFASSEAEGFARHVQALNLKVPHLAKILEFEQAVLATFQDEQPRVVVFEFNPLPLLRALTEGHLPSQSIETGEFEIEITPDGPNSAGNLEIEALQQAFPYH